MFAIGALLAASAVFAGDDLRFSEKVVVKERVTVWDTTPLGEEVWDQRGFDKQLGDEFKLSGYMGLTNPGMKAKVLRRKCDGTVLVTMEIALPRNVIVDAYALVKPEEMEKTR